jgi:hypothetical protein
MGWGDIAAEALKAAKAAFEAGVRTEAKLDAMGDRLGAFEQRMLNDAESNKRLTAEHIDRLESRIRELEKENAVLHGKVTSVVGDALRTLIRKDGAVSMGVLQKLLDPPKSDGTDHD